ncbi:hypothetical protein BV25DRAFT_1820876 [Artomyces pyxidatus]|uniref:Uncharacterized protein n=1 Tax=Artomyces pyxidatus TaxID=48021 RepID=A0ACB8TB52_9AGAM|nr:hypothetical protein BV25DRAFT_1820876 [Artomyces pyxidatus]
MQANLKLRNFYLNSQLCLLDPDYLMASTENVPFFKKKRARPTTTRQRTPPPATESTPSVASSSKSQVVLPSRKTNTNLLSAGTKRTSSQRDQGDDGDDESRREGPGMNWASEGGHVNAALQILEGDEAEEMLAKRMRKDDDGDQLDVPQDGLYRGQKAYNVHLAKNKDVPKAMRVGPQRASGSTIRTVTIVDYQPDVCKDYKETGFCGFGDTCKFLHDRGTYLAGWQLDKLAADPKKQADDGSGSSDSDDEDIPFKCIIGHHPYTDPVVTRCGHYFCSPCAIKRFAKTPKCAACGAPTGGIFNRADKVIAKLQKTKRYQEEEAEEAGEDGNGEEDVQIEGLGEEAAGGVSDADEDE